MQRQLRLGDILDDYCPRERRLTNHAIVAMVGDDVKQTRCTTCDAEHEYKEAKVPRQRKKDTPAGWQAQILASGPKRPDATRPATRAASDRTGDPGDGGEGEHDDRVEPSSELPKAAAPTPRAATVVGPGTGSDDDDIARVAAALGLGARFNHRPPSPTSRGSEASQSDMEPTLDADLESDLGDDSAPSGQPEGPAHRRLIRATLPRLEGQQPAARPAPDFTIRTPTPAPGRPNRFRQQRQNQRAGQQPFGGGRTAQGGHGRPGGQRPGQGQGNANGNRQPQSQQARRFDTRNNKRSK